MTEPHPILQKKCTKCKKLFPPTNQFFGNDKSRSDGLYPNCKICRKAQGKIWREANPNYLKEYYQEHKEQHSEYYQEYRITHKEELQEKGKQYRQLNREMIREKNRTCRSINKEKYNKHHRQYLKTERGRAIKRAGFHKRRVQKKAIQGILTAKQIQTKLKAQKYRCYYAACNFSKFQKIDGKYIYHLEHTIPLSRTEHNPRHDVNYVVLACPACNMEKHNKLPHEWENSGRLF